MQIDELINLTKLESEFTQHSTKSKFDALMALITARGALPDLLETLDELDYDALERKSNIRFVLEIFSEAIVCKNFLQTKQLGYYVTQSTLSVAPLSVAQSLTHLSNVLGDLNELSDEQFDQVIDACWSDFKYRIINLNEFCSKLYNVMGACGAFLCH